MHLARTTARFMLAVLSITSSIATAAEDPKEDRTGFDPSLQVIDGKPYRYKRGRFTESVWSYSYNTYEPAGWISGKWVPEKSRAKKVTDQVKWELAHPRLAAKAHEDHPPFEYVPTIKYSEEKNGLLTWDTNSNNWVRWPLHYTSDREYEQMLWEKAHPTAAKRLFQRYEPARAAAAVANREEFRRQSTEEAAQRDRTRAEILSYYKQTGLLSRFHLDMSYKELVAEYREDRHFDRFDNAVRSLVYSGFFDRGGGSPRPAATARKAGPTPAAVRPGNLPNLNDSGLDLVGRWVKSVDARWNAAMRRR